jgi:phosphoribosylformylglycinamidine synthase
MGGRTGRDGIHGVTFASEELTTASEIEDRPAVQIGDPFTKKKVLEASLEIMEKFPVTGVKDLGGGGLTCCISELADKCGNGALVELTKIPLREEGMTPYEIMLSESQERMVFVINPSQTDAVLDICEKYELPAAVIGEVTNTQLMVVEEEGEIIADLPANLLADPPTVEREAIAPVKNEEYVEVEHPSAEEALLKLLSSQNMASKRWVYRQYDHEVQIRTMVKPGDDAAVLRVDDEKAVALTADCNSIHTKLDPYHGGAGSVAEAIRNVVSMGAEPLCVVDCLNFGNPEKPEVFWQFRECVKGMSDIAGKFETPVISGNVSFYNETEGITVNPSPVVGVVGVANIGDVRTMDFKKEGDHIIVIGWTYNELDGSEYQRTVHGLVQGSSPQIRIDDEIQSAHSILDLLKDDVEGNITAIHDCSAGGIGIALSEMAIKSGLGASVDISLAPREDMSEFETLLSESHARYIITVKNDAVDAVLEKIDAPCSVIGEVKGNELIIDELAQVKVEKLQESYNGVIEKFMA